MSQASLNSAKNRRGNAQSTGLRPGQNAPPQQYNPNIAGGQTRAASFPPSSVSPIPNSTTATGATPPVMTLPQVIAYVDKRLCVLETFMADTKKTGSVGSERTVTFAPDTNNAVNVMPNNLQETIEEFDKRYQLLAEEIENLKNIVLSLQSYTMDVNKMLLEDRARIYAQLQEENPEGVAEGEPQVAGEDNQ